MGNREDLLAGARRCLVKKGYGRTTVRDIAAASAVSMAAIGYHFGSREKLLNEALLQALDELGKKTGGLLAGEGARVGAESYRRLFESIDAQPHLWLSSIEAYAQAVHTDELRQQMADGMQAGREGSTAEVLGVEEDTVDPEDARSLGSVVMALTSGLGIQRLIDPERAPSPDEVIAGLRKFADLLEDGKKKRKR